MEKKASLWLKSAIVVMSLVWAVDVAGQNNTEAEPAMANLSMTTIGLLY